MKSTDHKFTVYISWIIIFITIYGNSWIPGGPTIQRFEIYLILLLTGIVFLVEFEFDSLNTFLKSGMLSYDNKYLVLLVVLFLISIFVYNLHEVSTFFGIVYNATFFCFVYLYFFKLPAILLSSKELLRRFLLITSLTGFAIAFLGVFIFLTGTSPAKLYAVTTHSIIVHPNFVAYFYTISIITSFYFYLNYKNNVTPIIRLFLKLSIFVQLIAQLFTYGRGGYIGTIFGLGVLFAFYFRKKAILIFPLLVAPLILIIPAFWKFKGGASYVSRSLLLLVALDMISSSQTALLWGYGSFDNMGVFIKYLTLYNLNTPGISDPHNTVLRLIMMFGLIFTTVLLIYFFKLCLRVFLLSYRSRDNDEKFFYGYLLSLVIGLSLMGLFDSGLVSTVFFYSEFLLIGSGLMYYKIQANRKQSAKPIGIQ